MHGCKYIWCEECQVFFFPKYTFKKKKKVFSALMMACWYCMERQIAWLVNYQAFPVAVLALQLAISEGPDQLPADKDTQEVLCGKLRVLETDLCNISCLISVRFPY